MPVYPSKTAYTRLVDAHVVEPAVVRDVVWMCRLGSGKKESIDLSPAVFVEQMAEFCQTPKLVCGVAAVIDSTGHAVPKRLHEFSARLETPIERRPDFTDSSPDMSVRGAERRTVELRRQFTGAIAVRVEILRIVHLDPVDPIAMGTDIVGFEADGRKLRMGREDSRVLALELRHRPLQGDEVRNGVGQPDREDVLSVPPVTGEHLPSGDDEKLRVTEPFGTGLNLRKANEMRRVHDRVKITSLRPFDDPLVEEFHVCVEVRPIHTFATGRGSVIRSDSAGRILYADADFTAMWECAIDGCEFATKDAEELLVHQVTTHERHRCTICGTTVPDGYFAIRHAFSEHSRAEYLRNYEADTGDIRLRETVRRELEAEADVEAIVRQLGGDGQEATTQS